MIIDTFSSSFLTFFSKAIDFFLIFFRRLFFIKCVTMNSEIYLQRQINIYIFTFYRNSKRASNFGQTLDKIRHYQIRSDIK